MLPTSRPQAAPSPIRATVSRPRKKASKRAVHLTARDLLLLQRLCRYECTTVPALQHTVAKGKHRSGIYAQVKRLVRAGLIEDLQTGPSNECRPRNIPALLVPTKAGYAVAGTGLTYKQPTLRTLFHTLSVSVVGLAMEAASIESGAGFTVLTDREIKSQIQTWRAACERARKTGRKAPPVPANADWIVTSRHTGGATGDLYSGERGSRTHASDLILRFPDGNLEAVEVELSNKNDDKLRLVMEAFAESGKYRKVRYYTSTKAIEAKVMEAWSAAGNLMSGLELSEFYTAWYTESL